MNTIAYPRLLKRVRAALIDSILVPLVMFGMVIMGGALEVSNLYGKALFLLLPIFILEPGLVSYTGGTIGHHLQGIQVRKKDGSGNINFFAATIRFVVKVLLGWLSFIFVLTTRKHQALHDVIANSIVTHRNPTGLPAYEVLAERDADGTYNYPATWRRVLVIAVYWVAASFVLILLTYLALSENCLYGRGCTTLDHVIQVCMNLIWLISIGWLTVRGWTGRLYGCRRRLREQREY